jgi:Fe-Mn family superoxide dismutase
MTPNGGGEPEGELAEAINQAFGKFDQFADAFEANAVGQFGSGWGWLVFDAGKIKLIRTPNAVTPLAGGQTALLTCDVWEHAYYLDYQNRRADFVRTFLEHLVNWPFVAANLANAKQQQG